MTVCAGGAGRHDQNPLVSTQAASLLDYTVDISGAADFPLVKAHGQCFRVCETSWLSGRLAGYLASGLVSWLVG